MGEFLRDGQDRHLVRNGQAIAFQGDNFARMIRKYTQVFQSKIYQNLSADAAFVLKQSLPCDIAVKLAAGVIQDLWQRTHDRDGIIDCEAASRVVQIHEHAAILGDDGFERALDDLVAITLCRGEDISGEAVRMHAAQIGRERRRGAPRTTAMCCSWSTSEA